MLNCISCQEKIIPIAWLSFCDAPTVASFSYIFPQIVDTCITFKLILTSNAFNFLMAPHLIWSVRP
jgi:hypothetical protein